MKGIPASVLVVLSVAILCGVTALISTKPKMTKNASEAAKLPRESRLPQRQDRGTAVPVAPLEAIPQEPSATPESAPRATPENAADQTGKAQNPSTASNPGGPPPPKEPLHDPLARVALAFVGTDSEAEGYWFAAINDPGLPAHERQDLIEDLNEDGLSDPKHPTVDDLPLIVSRLMIIDEVGPYAMDKVNADAFQEAYKDLVNLADVAMGGGQPVR
jgi:hypothetical protein